eukprot:scaffold35107_cov28-Tisochrysis_lutea.AAC.5
MSETLSSTLAQSMVLRTHAVQRKVPAVPLANDSPRRSRTRCDRETPAALSRSMSGEDVAGVTLHS